MAHGTRKNAQKENPHMPEDDQDDGSVRGVLVGDDEGEADGMRADPAALAMPARAREGGRGMSVAMDAGLARLDEIESMAAGGLSLRALRRQVQAKYGIGAKHAAKHVRAVFDRWKHEAPDDERNAKRQHLIETAWEGVRLAYTKRSMTATGIDYSSPDVAAARNMLETIARLEGIAELPPGPTIEVKMTVEQRVQVGAALVGHYYGEELAQRFIEQHSSSTQALAGSRDGSE